MALIMMATGCGSPQGEQSTTPPPGTKTSTVTAEDLGRIEGALVEKHGAAHADRIRQGLKQVAERWQARDGDSKALAAFAAEHFITDEKALHDTFEHLEYALEMLDGHALEIERELSRYQDLDMGEMRPVDALLAAYSPASHYSEDLFKNRVAFVALLNFPITTLEQRLGEGKSWPRERWATARLAGRFENRLPADVLQRIEEASSAGDRYIDSYNICMDRLADEDGGAGFSDGMKLISHWGLRDEIKAQYGKADGLERQRLIAKIMDRIVRQEIPGTVVNSNELEWDPERNLVREPGAGEWREAEREPDRRYEVLLDVFRAYRLADPYFPTLPNHIDRSFALEREIPEARMRELLESVLTSETAHRVGELIGQRLGRPLEPFDIWYTGFRPGSGLDEEELNRITRERYPTPAAFRDDIPRILEQLGFEPERARFLAEHIEVDPARGAGHAIGAERRGDSAHLRTRVGVDGMDYKGFNIAIHELGHNVEQVISISLIDHTLISGVPNTGFTEAFAFLFQSRDLDLLGQTPAEGTQVDALRILNRFWSTFEIAGVAILDMEIWHWMYDHPEATPAELREAVLSMARDVWNRYYAPVFGVRDIVLPAIYSHIIAYGLYTPDYPLGFIITTQVEDHVRSRNLATEMERMCRLGRIAPDIWMEQAVGEPVSSDALLRAASAALEAIAATDPASPGS